MWDRNDVSLQLCYACNLATMTAPMWVFLCLSLSNAALIDENVPIEQVCPRPPDRHLFLFLTLGDQAQVEASVGGDMTTDNEHHPMNIHTHS